MTTVQCPHCKKPVAWSKESIFRPFCSERCRLIDLGAWADGSYAIPVNQPPDSSNETLDTLDENQIDSNDSDEEN